MQALVIHNNSQSSYNVYVLSLRVNIIKCDTHSKQTSLLKLSVSTLVSLLKGQYMHNCFFNSNIQKHLDFNRRSNRHSCFLHEGLLLASSAVKSFHLHIDMLRHTPVFHISSLTPQFLQLSHSCFLLITPFLYRFPFDLFLP